MASIVAGAVNGTQYASVTQHSFSLTVQDVSDSAVVICVHFGDANATVTSVSVGGTAGSLISRAVPFDTTHASEMWVVLDPPVGEQTVLVTLSAAAESAVTAQQLQDVDQVNPVRGSFATQGNIASGEISAAVESSADDVVIGTLAINTTSAPTPGVGVTPIRSTTTSDIAYAGWMAGAAPTQTFSVTSTAGSGSRWSLVVASFRSPSAGGGGSSLLAQMMANGLFV